MEKYYNIIDIKYKKKYLNIFKNNNDLIFNIGFGIGFDLIATVIKNPNKNFIGCEIYLKGIKNCLKNIKKLKIKNLKIINYNSKILNKIFNNNSLKSIEIFFPEPWPKNKHIKRKIIQNNFLKIIFNKLKKGGIFHFITDCNLYIKYIFKKIKKFYNLFIKKKILIHSFKMISNYEFKNLNLNKNNWKIFIKK